MIKALKDVSVSKEYISIYIKIGVLSAFLFKQDVCNFIYLLEFIRLNYLGYYMHVNEAVWKCFGLDIRSF